MPEEETAETTTTKKYDDEGGNDFEAVEALCNPGRSCQGGTSLRTFTNHKQDFVSDSSDGVKDSRYDCGGQEIRKVVALSEDESQSKQEDYDGFSNRDDLAVGTGKGAADEDVVNHRKRKEVDAGMNGEDEEIDGEIHEKSSYGRMSCNAVDDERERRIAAAWDHWKKIGEPKMHVAPMVDQSELPFRMLCRKYGATAAYTPMLHSRLFVQDPKYRMKEFTTCPEDRPLLVQFCANNPDTLLEAARLVETYCDYVDINLGCPQRIAKKGNYGAFLMDNLPLIKSLVSNLASNLTVPVSCKIRLFPSLDDTLAYARMLEEAGCSLLAVHGRTRDQKNGKLVRADWDAIQAVKKALRIPVLANGNIRWLEDVHTCIASTGVDGVMSAESLLENPALYAGYRLAHSADDGSSVSASVLCHAGESETPRKKMDELALMLEYLNLCEKHPVPMRMIRGHVHKILGNFWFKCNPDIRDELNKQYKLTILWLKDMVQRLMARRDSSSSVCPTVPETQAPMSDPLFSPLELPVVTIESREAVSNMCII